MGFGLPELIAVAVVATFFFGRQQVKSWIKTIFETKQEIQKASKEFENSSKTTNAE